VHGNSWAHQEVVITLARFGIIEIDENRSVPDVPAGKYVGFVRIAVAEPAIGANIANHYTRLAISKRRLPQGSKTSCMAYDG